MRAAIRIQNEFEGGHIQPFIRHHRLHPWHQCPAKIAVGKTVNHLEGEAWLGISHAGAGLQRADIRRAELEALAGVDAHGIGELAPDEFDPCDGLVRRCDVTLYQRDAIDRRVKVSAVHIFGKPLARPEEANAKPLASAVMFGDYRLAVKPRKGLDNAARICGRHRVRNIKARPAKRRILDHLGNFEIEGRPTIDHAPAMALQPGKDAGRHFRRIAVAPGMRRRAHPVVEHPLRRQFGQCQIAIGEVPVNKGKTTCSEGLEQGRGPVSILMNHMDGRAGGRVIGYRHVSGSLIRVSHSREIE